MSNLNFGDARWTGAPGLAQGSFMTIRKVIL